ncbi:MAG: VOC family protein [Spirochaetales bacterium]|nr:hypothetical protein [Leptospiraceae bacterium]MCP5481280.1 VOC family protein [Spirochaetales bacterium]MCP5485716.1 VOC family protein [Spirochaetales bacterium]
MKLFGLPINHLVIASPRPLALASFYESVLGLERLYMRQNQEDAATESVWLGNESGPILMIERATRLQSAPQDFFEKPSGLYMIALQISAGDRPAWETHLQKNRVTIVHQTDYTMYFVDPEGNRIGLSWFRAEEFLRPKPT